MTGKQESADGLYAYLLGLFVQQGEHYNILKQYQQILNKVKISTNQIIIDIMDKNIKITANPKQ